MEMTQTTIIEIAQLSNGAHRNQTGSDLSVPDGWALLPPEVGTPDSLENFPFGDITTEEIDGVMTVTGWAPLPMPEPEPEPAEETDGASWSDMAAAITEGVNAV